MSLISPTPETPRSARTENQSQLPPVARQEKEDTRLSAVLRNRLISTSGPQSVEPLPDVSAEFEAEFGRIMNALEVGDADCPGGILSRIEEQVVLMRQGVVILSLDNYFEAASHLPTLVELQHRYVAGYPSQAASAISERIDQAIGDLESVCADLLELWDSQLTEEIQRAESRLNEAYNAIFDKPAVEGAALMRQQRAVNEQVELLRFFRNSCLEATHRLGELASLVVKTEEPLRQVESLTWVSRIKNIAGFLIYRSGNEKNGAVKRQDLSSIVANRVAGGIDAARQKIENKINVNSFVFNDMDKMLEESTTHCFEELNWLAPDRYELLDDLISTYTQAGEHYSRHGSLQVERRVGFLKYIVEQSRQPSICRFLDEGLRTEIEHIGQRLDEIYKRKGGQDQKEVLELKDRIALHHIVMGEGNTIFRESSQVLDLLAEAVNARSEASVHYLLSSGSISDPAFQGVLFPLLEQLLLIGASVMCSFVLSQMPVTEESYYQDRVLLPQRFLHPGQSQNESMLPVVYQALKVNQSFEGIPLVVKKGTGVELLVCSALSSPYSKVINDAPYVLNEGLNNVWQKDVEYCRQLRSAIFLSHSWEIRGKTDILEFVAVPIIKETALAISPSDSTTGNGLDLSTGSSNPDPGKNTEGKPAGAYMVAHRWSLEGSYAKLTLADITGSLDSFGKEYSGVISDVELSEITSVLTRYTLHLDSTIKVHYDHSMADITIEDQRMDDLYAEYAAGNPVLIDSGYVGHSISVVFRGDYLFIANKGRLSVHPIEAYRIDRHKVTANTLVGMSEFVMEREFEEWRASIGEVLGGNPDDPLAAFVSNAYPAAFGLKQQVGNCAYESHETAVFGMLLFERLPSDFDPSAVTENEIVLMKTINDFDLWTQYTKIHALESYLRAFGVEPSLLETFGPHSLGSTDGSTQPVNFGFDADFVENVLVRASHATWNPMISANLELIEHVYTSSLRGYDRQTFSMRNIAAGRFYPFEIGLPHEEILKPGSISTMEGDLVALACFVPMAMRLFITMTEKWIRPLSF